MLNISVDGANAVLAFKRLERTLGVKFPRERRRIQLKGGKIVRDAIKANTPVAKNIRYSDGRVRRGGNLRRSIMFLRFKKSDKLFVGPKKLKGRSFRSNRKLSRLFNRNFTGANGYYGGIVETGRKKGPRPFNGRYYVKSALARTRRPATTVMLNETLKVLSRELKKANR